MTDAPTYHAIEWFDDVPRSIRTQAIFGILLMTFALGGFGLWAFRAPLAAAVIAQGSFVATGSNKIVQHLEGGIIKEILVAEGDLVRAGEPIVLLDETAALAKERELFLRRARLEAVNARLLAEYRLAEQIEFPALLTSREADPAIAEILESQRLNFAVSRRRLEGDVTLFENNIEALRFRAGGYETQLGAIERQIALLGEDMTIKETLLQSGLVRAPEVNALRRATAEAEGQIGRVEAEVSEARQMIAKHRKEIEQTRNAYAQAALDEMQAIQAELELGPRAVAQRRERAPTFGDRRTRHRDGGSTLLPHFGRRDRKRQGHRRDPSRGRSADHRGEGAAFADRQRQSGRGGSRPSVGAEPEDDAGPSGLGLLRLGGFPQGRLDRRGTRVLPRAREPAAGRDRHDQRLHPHTGNARRNNGRDRATDLLRLSHQAHPGFDVARVSRTVAEIRGGNVQTSRRRSPFRGGRIQDPPRASPLAGPPASGRVRTLVGSRTRPAGGRQRDFVSPADRHAVEGHSRVHGSLRVRRARMDDTDFPLSPIPGRTGWSTPVG